MASPTTSPQQSSVEDLPIDPLASQVSTARRGERMSQIWRLIRENRKASVGLAIVAVFVVLAIIGPFVAPYNATQMGVGLPQQGPGPQHWLGTTQVGQDIFSQLLVGTRDSLLVGVGTGFLTTLIAVIVGLTAGYLGGWVDDVISVIINVFLTLPFIPIMIVVASYAAAFNLKGPLVLIGVLTLTGWAWGARVKRSQILTLRNKDFVMAARVSGESWVRIIAFEIIPNMLSLIAASFFFSTVFAILGEAALEFLGLGDPNTVTWGVMLNQAETNSALLNGSWYWFVPPGLCIAIFALGLTLVNYAIDEITNPKLRALRVPRSGSPAPTATASTLREPTSTGGTSDASIA